jgi:hypothetical protein
MHPVTFEGSNDLGKIGGDGDVGRVRDDVDHGLVREDKRVPGAVRQPGVAGFIGQTGAILASGEEDSRA